VVANHTFFRLFLQFELLELSLFFEFCFNLTRCLFWRGQLIRLHLRPGPHSYCAFYFVRHIQALEQGLIEFAFCCVRLLKQVNTSSLWRTFRYDNISLFLGASFKFEFSRLNTRLFNIHLFVGGLLWIYVMNIDWAHCGAETSQFNLVVLRSFFNRRGVCCCVMFKDTSRYGFCPHIFYLLMHCCLVLVEDGHEAFLATLVEWNAYNFGLIDEVKRLKTLLSTIHVLNAVLLSGLSVFLVTFCDNWSCLSWWVHANVIIGNDFSSFVEGIWHGWVHLTYNDSLKRLWSYIHVRVSFGLFCDVYFFIFCLF